MDQPRPEQEKDTPYEFDGFAKIISSRATKWAVLSIITCYEVGNGRQ